jgi:hypothetical protein
MKFWKLCGFLLFISSSCVANGAYIGKVQPFFYGNTLYLIPVDSQVSNKPVCATRRYIRLPDNTGDPIFNAKYSLILAYWTSKQELVITGSGNCTSEGDEIIKTIMPK